MIDVPIIKRDNTVSAKFPNLSTNLLLGLSRQVPRALQQRPQRSTPAVQNRPHPLVEGSRDAPLPPVARISRGKAA